MTNNKKKKKQQQQKKNKNKKMEEEEEKGIRKYLVAALQDTHEEGGNGQVLCVSRRAVPVCVVSRCRASCYV